MNMDFMLKRRQTKIFECGRSMVEMLGVLAVIGVLSIGGIAGYRLAFHKYNANVIIQDAQLAYTELHGEKVRNPIPWTVIQWTPQCNKVIEKHRDNLSNDYIRVRNISLEDCRQVVLTAVPPRITLFNEDGEIFETCTDTNTIVFAFDGTPAPGVSCESGADCEQMGMFCQPDKNVCRGCPDGYKVNSAGDGCDIICQSETETTCESKGMHWCCDSKMICGEALGTCEESDGRCSYKINEQETTIKSDCSYLYTQQVQTKSHDCEYTIQNTANGSVVQKVKGCPNNQFCNLIYINENCSGAISNDTTGTVYGVCSSFSAPLFDCTIKSVSNPMNMIKGCPKGQFCNLIYVDELCQTRIPDNNGANKMYGVCSSLSQPLGSCPVLSVTDAVTAVKKCPRSKYCYLAYTDENCTSVADNNGAEMLFGVCNDLNKRNTTCPVPQGS